MKKPIIIFAAIFFMACNNENTDKPKEADKKTETAGSDISYPYKASYSNDFKIGDANHSKLILDFFTGWEDGSMKNWKDVLADSVWIDFPDGQHFWLSKDSVISMGRQFRSHSSNIKLDIEGFMPIHLNDKNEDYVLVWEKDYITDKNTNKLDSVGSHSFWQVKNNKIAGWREYSRKLVAEPMNK
jgi:hypothetical protein